MHTKEPAEGGHAVAAGCRETRRGRGAHAFRFQQVAPVIWTRKWRSTSSTRRIW